MDTDDTIRKLVTLSAGGDATGFKELYEHLVERIYAYNRSRTSTDEQATDLTQDSFVQLYQALRNFEYRSLPEFYSFVFRIVRRTLAHHYADKHMRAEKKRIDIESDMLPSVTPDNELRRDVERALATLDESTREIVVLHHWSRLTFSEISAIVNMTESAVRVRHHRAVKSLEIYFSNTK